jgi:hypothetical protein
MIGGISKLPQGFDVEKHMGMGRPLTYQSQAGNHNKAPPSRLQKVPNVRNLLHNPSGSMSQRMNTGLQNIKKSVQHAGRGVHKKVKNLMSSGKTKKVQSDAIANIKQLQSQVMKGPTRRPPPPPKRKPMVPKKPTHLRSRKLK